MFCVECGHILPETANFCYNCGVKVVSTTNSYMQKYEYNIPCNELWYTSINEDVVCPYIEDFGANIISNSYQNGLGKIIFNKPVSHIGNDVFYFRKNLKSIIIPNKVIYIGKRSFNGCVNLDCIDIPDSLNSIGEEAFAFCSSLKEITIPDSVMHVGENVFCDCTSLSSIHSKFSSTDKRCLIINSTLNSFARAGLKEYVIPNGVTSIGREVFQRCNKLTSITIPDSVIKIEEFAFNECTSLYSINFGNNISNIDGAAFMGCESLRTINIPKSVAIIGTGAFCGCSSLTSIFMHSMPNGNDAMFCNNADGRKIYVPKSLAMRFREAKYWSIYKYSIVGYEL